MADSAWLPGLAAAATESRDAAAPRHTVTVRVTHWVAALCFFALLVSGIEILLSHPRFYWGEDGNVLMKPLFTLPTAASRATVPTGYGYVLPDQNGWSRSLHFEAGWAIVLTGLFYVIAGLMSGHFRRNLVPTRAGLSGGALTKSIAAHVRFRRPDESQAGSYNVLQRLAYLAVVFVLFPLTVWTGLAMSPAIVSVIPSVVTLLGGQQSARTIHFFCTILLVLFVIIHIGMVWVSGFGSGMRAMITGHATPPPRATPEEQP
ncbi:MAG: cytochrome b/b6 domain-containing protein [Acidobacteriota bacterium]|nr:cytochrome b/b6 domain-containing protein [Acidobacteriota bacterium]